MATKNQSEIVISLVIAVEASKDDITSLVREMLSATIQLFANVEIVAVPVPLSGVTFEGLKTALASIPNSRVLRLTNTSDHDDAILAGIYSCIGDYVIVTDPLSDMSPVIGSLVQQCREGAGIAFAKPAATASRMLRRLGCFATGICRRTFGSAAALALEIVPTTVFCMSRDVCNLVLSMHPRGWQLRTLLAGFRKQPSMVEYPPEGRREIGIRLWLRRTLGVLRSSQKSGGRINLAVSVISLIVFLWNIVLMVGIWSMRSDNVINSGSLTVLVWINLLVWMATLLVQLGVGICLSFLSNGKTDQAWFIIEEASGTAPFYRGTSNIIEGAALKSPIENGAPSATGGEDSGRRRL